MCPAERWDKLVAGTIQHLYEYVLCEQIQCSGSQIDCRVQFHDALQHFKPNTVDDRVIANSEFLGNRYTDLSVKLISSLVHELH